MHRLVTTQYDHELFVDFFTLENHLLWFALTGFPQQLIFLFPNLIASKKTDLKQENSPFTSPFRSLLSVRSRQLCMEGNTGQKWN